MRWLLIVKDYPPVPDASGKIVSTIAKELIRNGHEVHVITRMYGSNETVVGENGEVIHGVKRTYFEKLLQKRQNTSGTVIRRIWFFFVQNLRRVWRALNIFSFPNAEPSITKQIVRKAKSLCSVNDFNCVVGFFRPFSDLAAAVQLGKEINGLKVISYYFDLVEPKDCPKFMPKRLYRFLISRGDERIFENSDLVVLPTSAEGQMTELGNRFSKKILYMEFPTFIIEENDFGAGCVLDNKNEDSIKFLFAGTLDRDYRNPMKFLKLIYELAKRNINKLYEVHFYGGGNCQEIIRSFEMPNNVSVKIFGKVEKKVVDREVIKSDVLVNISNAYKSIVPSKIFEMFATGKPVVNIATQGDDGSFQYLKKYPLCFQAKWDFDEDLDQVIKGLEDFLIRCIGKHENLSELSKIFKKNTPQYVVEMLVARIEELYGKGKK